MEKIGPLNLGVMVTTVGFTSGVLYLICFWGSYHINIFEFATLSDLLAASIMPLVSLMWPTVFVLLVGLTPAIENLEPRVVDPTRDVHWTFRRAWKRSDFATKCMVIAVLAIMVLTAAIYSYYYRKQLLPVSPYLAALFIAFSVAFNLSRSELMAKLVPVRSVRILFLGCVLAVPLISAIAGFLDMWDPMETSRGHMYVCRRDVEGDAYRHSSEYFNFLGKVGNHYMFTTKREPLDVRVYRVDSVDRLVLKWARVGDTVKCVDAS